MFRFKKFAIVDKNSALKIGTDAVIIGASIDVRKAKRILDIGTGCGIIALMLAQRSHASIDAIEPHVPSAEDAKNNFYTSPWENRLSLYIETLENYVEITNKTYDLIVSNPPFFENDLLSADTNKTQAKHAINLRLEDIIILSCKILSKNGKLEIIIPIHREKELIQTAQKNQLQLQRKIIVYPKKGKSAHRLILRFSFEYVKYVEEELIIRNANNEYTNNYKDLTRDFHLNM
jgi:tRNA1Val (adenine37-N6)-methyltransferase